MSNITTISRSRSELMRRRRRLRWRRRWRLLRMIWQVLLVGSLASGLVWLIAQPGWVIRDADQISVDGVEFLSEDTVRGLIPLSYPSSILDVQPEAIAQELKARGPIASVVVSRQLFPPSLAVHITERHPVAVLIGNSYVKSPGFDVSSDVEPTPPAIARSIPSQRTPTGLIDENGAWMPLESYLNINQDLDLPQLRLIGMQEIYRRYWSKLYQSVQRSPVKVYEIDWRNPANLIINSELGVVYLGSYDEAKFALQLETLDRMRNLPEVLDLDTIEYLDLDDPKTPILQFNPGAPYYGQTSTPLLPALDPELNVQENDSNEIEGDEGDDAEPSNSESLSPD